MIYDTYNREERAVCSHLFRLLHEKLALDPANCVMANLLELLANKEIILNDGNMLSKVNVDILRDTRIYTEVALIRDAYHTRKPNVTGFMDSLVKLVAIQEEAEFHRLYSELPEVLKNPAKTHPNQIAQKAAREGIRLSTEEWTVYKAIQGMFNAKPDLSIAVGNQLIVFEAKLTEPFQEEQMKRTRNITQVWAELLYNDLGYISKPVYTVLRLGSRNVGVDLSWEEICEIARIFLPEYDRTRKCLEYAIEF